MRAITLHGALLVVALGAAYLTWSHSSDAPAAPGSTVVWEADSTDVEAIRYESPDRRITIERRSDEAGSYFWTTVEPVVADPAAAAAAANQFLLGENGAQLVGGLAPLRALRDLGAVDADAQREYGLADKTGRLTVDVGGTTRELLVGGVVFGSGDRYVKDPATDRVYVVQSTLVTGLESPDALAERRLHAFKSEEVAGVVLHAPSVQRTMHRRASAEGTDTWAPENAPDKPDETFATFMDRVQQLWADRYAPEVDRSVLRELIRLDYQDERGASLGYLALMRTEAGAPVYYLVTEYSRVPVRPFAGTAEALARDVDQLFGGSSAAAAAMSVSAKPKSPPGARPRS